MSDGGIRVNMTSQEAASESRDIELVPKGKYLVAVTNVDVKEVTSEPKPGKQDNRGKPYYAITFTIQGTDYDGRQLWTNAMCFSGALYTIVNMLKALDIPFSGTDDNPTFQVPGYEANVIPEPGWWLGQQMVVGVVHKRGAIKDKETQERYNDKAEPVGFFPARDWDASKAPTKAKVAKSAAQSLLP